ncbi:hypothetical protein BDY19DRAFT_998025 [Irpex rosettiformis]|uniref:Uncharacterized protein n=1 Tax=Irpex rosettiformis TaxID=378272 RepID=A0ACB8TQ15_9APHY|nr:hypothetical protein BDY19DRAFT_998025 [Irpex rosettiformis]
MPSLPNELVIECLQHLDVKSLLRFASTCTHYSSLIKTSTTLQSIFELAFLGYEGAPWLIPSAELLERVKRHTEAWRTLCFTSEKFVFTSFAQYSKGLCCEITREDSSSHLTFYQAPTVHRGVPEQSWGLNWEHDTSRALDGAVFDPARDLLVIVEVDSFSSPYRRGPCAHFLSLHTGLTHLTFGRGGPLPLGSYNYYDELLLFGNKLVIWDRGNPGKPPTLVDILTRSEHRLPSSYGSERLFLSPEHLTPQFISRANHFLSPLILSLKQHHIA